MKKTEEPGDRRQRIAEAAIAVIARDGGRGLSHRAVDAELALPVGSVSYYFRTRKALLDAAVARLVERDEQDVRELMASLRKPVVPASLVRELVKRWSQKEHRTWLCARFELLLEAGREGPDHPLIAARRKFMAGTQQMFEGLGAKAPAVSARRLIASVEGLLLDELFRAHSASVLDQAVTGLERWL
ncbi:MAG: TetR family transcriptional regulator [Polyangiales bacterium]